MIQAVRHALVQQTVLAALMKMLILPNNAEMSAESTALSAMTINVKDVLKEQFLWVLLVLPSVLQGQDPSMGSVSALMVLFTRIPVWLLVLLDILLLIVNVLLV